MNIVVFIQIPTVVAFLFIIGWITGFRLLAVFLAVSLGLLMIIADRTGYKLHPTYIAFTEDGILLKRANGKIKELGWKKIRGLRVEKNAAILVDSFFEPAVYIFGEAEGKALYYFKTYGVKKNPKLRETVSSLETRNVSETK